MKTVQLVLFMSQKKMKKFKWSAHSLKNLQKADL